MSCEAHHTPPENPGNAADGMGKITLRSTGMLLAFTLAFTALMAATYLVTKAPIAASQREEKLKLLGEVLPHSFYDNKLLEDKIVLPPTPELGLDHETLLYRARKGGQPSALVFEAAAPDGYSGHIGLLLALRPSGEVIAVRVTEHKETPGLGDYIDIGKDKNKTRPWITQFDGLGPQQVSSEEWKVKKDGGRFDQRAGATISARAVTNAVGKAVRYIAAEQDTLFASATDARQP